MFYSLFSYHLNNDTTLPTSSLNPCGLWPTAIHLFCSRFAVVPSFSAVQLCPLRTSLLHIFIGLPFLSTILFCLQCMQSTSTYSVFCDILLSIHLPSSQAFIFLCKILVLMKCFHRLYPNRSGSQFE